VKAIAVETVRAPAQRIAATRMIVQKRKKKKKPNQTKLKRVKNLLPLLLLLPHHHRHPRPRASVMHLEARVAAAALPTTKTNKKKDHRARKTLLPRKIKMKVASVFLLLPDPNQSPNRRARVVPVLVLDHL
jgi:hypothetical protein